MATPNSRKQDLALFCSAVRWKRLLASAQKGWLEEGYETIQHSTDRVKSGSCTNTIKQRPSLLIISRHGKREVAVAATNAGMRPRAVCSSTSQTELKTKLHSKCTEVFAATAVVEPSFAEAIFGGKRDGASLQKKSLKPPSATAGLREHKGRNTLSSPEKRHHCQAESGP